MSQYSQKNSKLPRCRCCLQPVYGFWQKNLVEPGGKFYVHCMTPACPLYFATREINDWLTMDLTQWGAVQHPRWVEPASSPARQPA
jgi:hypothetical protein